MDLKKYAIIFSSFNAKFIFTQTALKPFSYIDTLLLSKPDESQFRFFFGNSERTCGIVFVQFRLPRIENIIMGIQYQELISEKKMVLNTTP
jgi:hypothetical protein